MPLLVSACGGGASSIWRKSAGAKVFTTYGCDQCHTLSAVKAKGEFGPNLDLLKPDAATVAHQVRVGGQRHAARSRRRCRTSRSSRWRRSWPPRHARPARSRSSRRTRRRSPTAPTRAGSTATARRSGTSPTRTAAKAPRHAPGRQPHHARRRGRLPPDRRTRSVTPRWRTTTTTPAEALAHGAMTCNSGYYHGVIELSIAGHATRPRSCKIARKLCSSPAVNKNNVPPLPVRARPRARADDLQRRRPPLLARASATG